MRLLPNVLARRPLPAEYDLSGVVVDVKGTEFLPGDEVFGFISTGGYTARLVYLCLSHRTLQNYRWPLVKVHLGNTLGSPQIIWSSVLRTSLQLKRLALL